MPDTTPVAAPLPARVRVALVRRAHGVRGEVRCEALGGDARRFRPGTVLTTERGAHRLVVASCRPLDGDDVLLRFREVTSREEAAGLGGDYLCVPPSRARRLGADEWFVWQLVGLRAVTDDGADLGAVRDVEHQPSSDVIVIGDGAGELRVPLVREWVRSVDTERGVVVVTPWSEAP